MATLVFLSGLILASFYTARIRPVLISILMLLASLVPVLNIIPLSTGSNIIQDRFLLFSSAVFIFWCSVFTYRDFFTEKISRLAAAMFAALLFINVTTTLTVIPLWKDDLSLWTWAIGTDPGSRDSRLNYSSALNDKGMQDEAISVIDELLEEKPTPGLLFRKGGIL